MIAFLTGLLFLPLLGVVIPGSSIGEAAERYVRETLGAPARDVIVEFRGTQPEVEISGTEYSLRIGDRAPRLLAGNLSIPVDVLADGVLRKRVLVPVRLRIFGDVVVAARRMDRHQTISASDLAVRHMETTVLPGDRMASVADAVGRVTLKIIAEGEVVGSRACEPAPAVRQKQMVELVAICGSIRVSAPAVALEDGIVGRTIKVKKVGSNVPVAARVVSATTVEISAE